MHEALYQFIRAHYTEILAILPMMLLLTGLVIAVGIDPYIQKRQKRILLIICALVFSLITQNVLDHLTDHAHITWVSCTAHVAGHAMIT